MVWRLDLSVLHGALRQTVALLGILRVVSTSDLSQSVSLGRPSYSHWQFYSLGVHTMPGSNHRSGNSLAIGLSTCQYEQLVPRWRQLARTCLSSV